MRVSVFCLAVLFWLGSVPVQAQETAPAGRPAQNACKVGVYVMDLYNIDTRGKRFGADMWAWSVCTGKKDALQSADWINSENQRSSLEYVGPTDSLVYSTRKVSGTYRASFDVRNYPFDRHTLRMVVEDGVDYASALKYVADDRNSRVAPNMTVAGWDLTRFAVVARESAYKTNFGDPALPNDTNTYYPQLEIVIEIKRSNLWAFWKLAAPVYISSMLILLTFLITDKDGQFLKARLGFLGGNLFAIVINMRGIEGVVGETNGLSLMENVHLMALSLAVIAVSAATTEGLLFSKGWDSGRIKKLDQLFFAGGSCFFIAGNVALISAAIDAG